jgi:hypothetical protein
MSTPGRLTVGSGGRVTGPAVIGYNHPFPCVNGRLGETGGMDGVLMHTMVCNLPQCITTFNNAARQASAHFGIAQDGSIHQFGPLGAGWEAWHAKAGNLRYYGIEHADDFDQHHPLTPAQIHASAQLVELLSRFAGFPLVITDTPGGRGFGTHVMGGAAYGGHTCPGPGPRAGQRHAIIELAKLIREGKTPAGPHEITWETAGEGSLAGLAGLHGTTPMRILSLTARHFGGYGPDLAEFVNGILSGDTDPHQVMPPHLRLRVPAPG